MIRGLASVEARMFHPPESDEDSLKFGLSSDWREAILIPGRGHEDMGATMRGEHCMEDANQEEVRKILRRRNSTPAFSKVLGNQDAAV